MATEIRESTISNIVLCKREYTNSAGKKIYVHEILMDNGDLGENHRQTENIPEKNGDKLKYEYTESVRGQFTDKKIKFIRDDDKQGYNGPKKSQYTKGTADERAMKDAMIMTQNATNRAIDLVCAGKLGIDQTEIKAEGILHMMLRIAERNVDKFKGKSS